MRKIILLQAFLAVFVLRCSSVNSAALKYLKTDDPAEGVLGLDNIISDLKKSENNQPAMQTYLQSALIILKFWPHSSSISNRVLHIVVSLIPLGFSREALYANLVSCAKDLKKEYIWSISMAGMLKFSGDLKEGPTRDEDVKFVNMYISNSLFYLFKSDDKSKVQNEIKFNIFDLDFFRKEVDNYILKHGKKPNEILSYLKSLEVNKKPQDPAEKNSKKKKYKKKKKKQARQESGEELETEDDEQKDNSVDQEGRERIAALAELDEANKGRQHLLEEALAFQEALEKKAGMLLNNSHDSQDLLIRLKEDYFLSLKQVQQEVELTVAKNSRKRLMQEALNMLAAIEEAAKSREKEQWRSKEARSKKTAQDIKRLAAGIEVQKELQKEALDMLTAVEEETKSRLKKQWQSRDERYEETAQKVTRLTTAIDVQKNLQQEALDLLTGLEKKAHPLAQKKQSIQNEEMERMQESFLGPYQQLRQANEQKKAAFLADVWRAQNNCQRAAQVDEKLQQPVFPPLCMEKIEEITDTLNEYGCLYNSDNYHIEKLIYLMVNEQYEEALALVEAGANPFISLAQGIVPLTEPPFRQKLAQNLVGQLLDERTIFKRNAIEIAIIKGQPKIVMDMIKAFENRENLFLGYKCHLFKAAKKGDVDFIEALYQKLGSHTRVNSLELPIRNSLFNVINAINNSGNTPAYVALRYGNVEFVKRLIERFPIVSLTYRNKHRQSAIGLIRFRFKSGELNIPIPMQRNVALTFKDFCKLAKEGFRKVQSDKGVELVELLQIAVRPIQREISVREGMHNFLDLLNSFTKNPQFCFEDDASWPPLAVANRLGNEQSSR